MLELRLLNGEDIALVEVWLNSPAAFALYHTVKKRDCAHDDGSER